MDLPLILILNGTRPTIPFVALDAGATSFRTFYRSVKRLLDKYGAYHIASPLNEIYAAILSMIRSFAIVLDELAKIL